MKFSHTKEGGGIMSSLKSLNTFKISIDRKFNKDLLPKRNGINNKLKFPPIPENSRANQLILGCRKLNQFMPDNKDS
jgi:hypothetical protein